MEKRSIFTFGRSDSGDLYSETLIVNNRRIKMSAEKALEIPAVKSSVDLISNAIAMLPIYLYENQDKSIEKIIDDEREKLLNLEANQFHDAQWLKKKIVEDYLFYGRAFIYKKEGGLHYLDASKVEVEEYTEDYVTISRRAFKYKTNTKTVDIPEENLIVVDSGNDGLLTTAADLFSLAISQEEINSSILSSGALPTGVLSSASRLTEAAIQRLRNSWRDLYSGSKKAGKTIILEEGLEFKPISMNLNELQMNDAKKVTLSDIARVFNIPEAMINSTANKYDSLAKNNTNFLQYCLSPIITAIEAALNRALLSEDEKEENYQFKFDTSEMLRTTEAEKVEVVSAAFKAGLYSYNQSMKKLDLPKAENDFRMLGIGAVQVFDNGRYVFLNHGKENENSQDLTKEPGGFYEEE